MLVVTPLRLEALAAGRALSREVVRRCGMGPAAAARLAADPGLARAPAVGVLGFGAALDPSLRPGDLVVASEVRGPGGVVPCPASPFLVAALRAAGCTVHHGPTVTVDHLVRGREREALRRQGALAADMETSWVAAGARGRPFVAVRAVVDGPGRELTRPLTTVRGGLLALRALRVAAGAVRAWGEAVGPRHVLLAAPRSFCAGVERAIDIVERALRRYGAPVYVRKQIVHNVHVVRDLERRGAVFVDEVTEVPPGATLVFSAHGVSPEVRREAAARSLRVIDATCPLVTKVHAEARRFAHRGYTVFLVGHEGHEEVEGTMGEAPEAIRLVETTAQAERAEAPDPSRVAYLTQTTLAVEEANRVVDVLRRRFPALRGPASDDICYATQNRQDAVKALAGQCDVLLVIGSANSSNSNRLVEVAREAGCPAYLVDDATEIHPRWLAGARTVGLTAGASAPESLVHEVVSALGGLGPVEVEERAVAMETVRFTLPREVR